MHADNPGFADEQQDPVLVEDLTEAGSDASGMYSSDEDDLSDAEPAPIPRLRALAPTAPQPPPAPVGPPPPRVHSAPPPGLPPWFARAGWWHA